MSYELALKAAGADILAFEHFGSYQGTWFAKIRHNGAIEWVSGEYGSCSGCDAFEHEFGWVNQPYCEEHYGAAKEGCTDCLTKASEYEKHLADFGKTYLDGAFSYEKALEVAGRDAEWDDSATEMIAWIKANA